jgi:hypothetical protein
MKILIVIILSFISLNLSAQTTISNTKWKAILLIPHAVDVTFTFKKDTLFMTAESSVEVGTLIFFQQGDTLMIKKVSGPSPCPEQVQGIYLINWLEVGKKFRLSGISDECESRIPVFTSNPFERMLDR